MTMRERQRAVQRYRGQIPSPGRPTVAWRQDRVRFWAAIARGVGSEDAALEIGVSSAVGARWFRHAGGVIPNLAPSVSGRYLSFTEREDIAVWHAQKLGVREIARRLGRATTVASSNGAPTTTSSRRTATTHDSGVANKVADQARPCRCNHRRDTPRVCRTIQVAETRARRGRATADTDTNASGPSNQNSESQIVRGPSPMTIWLRQGSG